VSPDHKLRIVEALRAAGEIVAVTGDGVNDAPALKRADVGIAMGRQGSDVAREVADLVLLDDDFATIVAAIREGRGIYANIEKFVRFMLSTNVGGMMLIIGGTVGAWALDLRDAAGSLFLPLTAVQILWINFLTDGPPAIAIGVDRNLDLMRAPPRPPASPLLDPPSLRFVLLSGALKAAIAGALLVCLPQLGTSLVAARTAVFLHTTLAQLLFVYPSRRLSGRTRTNVALLATTSIAMALQLATVLVPPLRGALGLVALGAREWGLVLAAVAVTWAGAEVILAYDARRARAPAGSDEAR
jgi:Ca2+-transporting ATPase